MDFFMPGSYEMDGDAAEEWMSKLSALEELYDEFCADPDLKNSPSHESVASDDYRMDEQDGGNLSGGGESANNSGLNFNWDTDFLPSAGLSDMLTPHTENELLAYLQQSDVSGGSVPVGPITTIDQNAVAAMIKSEAADDGSEDSDSSSDEVDLRTLSRPSAVLVGSGSKASSTISSVANTESKPRPARSKKVVKAKAVPKSSPRAATSKATTPPQTLPISGSSTASPALTVRLPAEIDPADILAKEIKLQKTDRDDPAEVEKAQKAAIQARINRQKKKNYIGSLEGQVSELTVENTNLKKDKVVLQKERDTLVEEVAYLKNVLANQSTLSNLLKNIDNVDNIRLTTSFSATRKRSAELDHDYDERPSKKSRPADAMPMGGGICLHVDKDDVSLEMCATCAKMSKGASRSTST